jgi:hypothetical protein
MDTYHRLKPVLLQKTIPSSGCLTKKIKPMFGLFKKKSEKEKLQEAHAALLKEAFELSKTNRSASDAKLAEAAKIADLIAALDG